MLIVHLKGGRGDSTSQQGAHGGAWAIWHKVADVACHLIKRDSSADPAKLQIIIPPKPDFLRNF